MSDLSDAYAELAAAIDRVRGMDPRGLHDATTGSYVVCYTAESLDEDHDVQTSVGYVVNGGSQPHHITIGILTVARELSMKGLFDTD